MGWQAPFSSVLTVGCGIYRVGSTGGFYVFEIKMCCSGFLKSNLAVFFYTKFLLCFFSGRDASILGVTA